MFCKIIAINCTRVHSCLIQPGYAAAAAELSACGAPVVAVSAKTRRALKQLLEYITPTSTVTFIGKSGVGKSTLINKLYGKDIQSTFELRAIDGKGRHTTT